MEGKRFDELSRAVAGMASRRGVLRGIVGGMIAGIAGGARLRSADAAQVKRKAGEICRKPSECESNLCVADATGRGRCGCAAGSTTCNGGCCQTYCDPQFGCFDDAVDIPCFDQCEQQLCFGSNGTFNGSFNGAGSCQEFCARECFIIT